MLQISSLMTNGKFMHSFDNKQLDNCDITILAF